MPRKKPEPTAIVTGASRGIGRAIAVALGGLKYNVVINFNQSRDAADECAELVGRAGGRGYVVQADVGNLEDHEKLVRAAHESFGGIDLLVNNAGVAPKVRADVLETTPESYDYVLDTNLRGVFFLTQRVARYMIEQLRGDGARPGRIVNIGSISAYTASVNRAEYCIAKAGIAMMTSVFAARLAEHGINVYEIRPGIIDTDMTSKVKDKYDTMIAQGVFPIRRWGTPDDVARAVAAIASDALPYSTGQVIDVDGGFHLHRL